MLRIVDTRTGRLAEIPSVRHHLLSICVHLSAGDAGTGLPDLRSLLVGDVLARTAELHGLQSRTFLTAPDLPAERTEALGRAMSALGIHPPATVGVHQPNGTLCAAADAHVHAAGTAAQDVAGGVLVGVGRVGPAPGANDVPDDALLRATGLPDALVPEGTDPLAVRLLLLGHAHRTPVTVTDATLDEARRTLGDWRRLVADWAQEPSRPVPADVLRHAHAVLADDLGVPAVLDMLTALVTRPDVPAGAKFETFALLDRVLGLDLAREVGHQHRPAP
ncbi:hypothetical protein PV371_23875 [Streptomyces sp. TX20-6-3]|uniref:hypothetical protein n=1 Tax=Streptomyces sp. TX20-6-3 TaxID=3028705 RepID=UPI0029AA4864|nr:hypothetical protein [Streptomyces sp. TX20-6-3]MDX2562674.1 hypothetical protein [Streptomyces sp. TX20-6-3]